METKNTSTRAERIFCGVQIQDLIVDVIQVDKCSIVSDASGKLPWSNLFHRKHEFGHRVLDSTARAFEITQLK